MIGITVSSPVCLGCVPPGEDGLVPTLHSCGFPFEDIAEPIPDVATHARVERPRSLRRPSRECLDGQSQAFGKFAPA
jgi:hypothetical protein